MKIWMYHTLVEFKLNENVCVSSDRMSSVHRLHIQKTNLPSAIKKQVHKISYETFYRKSTEYHSYNNANKIFEGRWQSQCWTVQWMWIFIFFLFNSISYICAKCRWTSTLCTGLEMLLFWRVWRFYPVPCRIYKGIRTVPKLKKLFVCCAYVFESASVFINNIW